MFLYILYVFMRGGQSLRAWCADLLHSGPLKDPPSGVPASSIKGPE